MAIWYSELQKSEAARHTLGTSDNPFSRIARVRLEERKDSYLNGNEGCAMKHSTTSLYRLLGGKKRGARHSF